MTFGKGDFVWYEYSHYHKFCASILSLEEEGIWVRACVDEKKNEFQNFFAKFDELKPIAM